MELIRWIIKYLLAMGICVVRKLYKTSMQNDLVPLSIDKETNGNQLFIRRRRLFSFVCPPLYADEMDWRRSTRRWWRNCKNRNISRLLCLFILFVFPIYGTEFSSFLLSFCFCAGKITTFDPLDISIIKWNSVESFNRYFYYICTKKYRKIS